MQLAAIFARALQGRHALLPSAAGALWVETTSLLRASRPGIAGLSTWVPHPRFPPSGAALLQQPVPWASIRPIISLRGVGAALLPRAAAAAPQLGGVRHASGPARPTPPFVGGKLKPYSAFRRRFKMTGSGKIRCMRPGNVHKRYNKGKSQLQELGQTKIVHSAWEKTMKRLGFTMRRFS